MSRYYPSSSRGSSRGRGYYSSSYGRGGGVSGGGGYSSSGYSSGGRGSYRGGSSSGYYDRRTSGGASSSGPGRYYPSRDQRDSTGGSTNHRERLEIAQKLVDTLIQSSGGSRRPSDHYSGAGEPAYKRPRTEGYDRDRSSSARSRHSDYHYHRREEYAERRPRDDFHAPSRRPYRARGYAPRRGYVSRGGPQRRQYDSESRDRSFDSRRDDGEAKRPLQRISFFAAGRHVVTKCPHCHARCATFADFRKHQLGREHMAAMRRVLVKIRGELGKMRLSQREEQQKLEAAEIEKDPEFENLPTQFCSLCRLQYREIEGVVHNETEWHRKQRAYQNPSCKTCNMNFPARIAYEKHQGTFTHIQKLYLSERRAERRDAAEFEKGGFMTVDSVGDVDEEGGRGREKASREDDGEPRRSATEKLAELPDYDGKHAVGSNYMRKTEVYHCGLCDIYIKITAKVNAVLVKHCMGKKHFENYRAELTKQAEAEEEERKAAEAEAEHEAEEDAKASQDDGEASDAPKSNGHDEEKADSAAAGDEPAGGEAAQDEPHDEPTSRADDAAWEQMDDNFLLGDDQEEEGAATEKRTVGVKE